MSIRLESSTFPPKSNVSSTDLSTNTDLHLALALETTFRETFIQFAKDSLEEMGYDRSLADMPIQVGQPVYGTMRKDGYLEFMAPGVVISISYVMATGLTALAFILERRDGLLERSLISGVQTSQILLAHAINQVFVMIIQIFMVLACTFFIFEIPSRGPFFWVVLLILLQGCTGMAFGKRQSHMHCRDASVQLSRQLTRPNFSRSSRVGDLRRREHSCHDGGGNLLHKSDSSRNHLAHRSHASLAKAS